MTRPGVLHRFFRDRDGHLVLWQFPNLPLLVGLAATAARSLLEGRAHRFVDLLAFGALFVWAWLEIFEGVTPFRRLLGAVVLVGLFVNRV